MKQYFMQIICIVLFCGIALAVPTSKEEHSTTASKKSYIIADTVPKDLPEHCVYNYVCKKKSKITNDEKECVKFCVAGVTCKPHESHSYKTSWCTEIHHDYFFEVLNFSLTTTTPAPTSIAQEIKKNVMQVNMIDFPCQPGYLPDRRGRCREIW
ncbi:hypothetical protein ACFFRR_006994 [Megaselia abdita]